jgi:hypothetical protein
MPAQRRIRAPRQRRVDRHIDAPERAHHIHTTRVQWGTAMDVPEPAEAIPESISIARCRELLGTEADARTDDEVLEIARHAEAVAHIVIALALQDGHIH